MLPFPSAFDQLSRVLAVTGVWVTLEIDVCVFFTDFVVFCQQSFVSATDYPGLHPEATPPGVGWGNPPQKS